MTDSLRNLHRNQWLKATCLNRCSPETAGGAEGRSEGTRRGLGEGWPRLQELQLDPVTNEENASLHGIVGEGSHIGIALAMLRRM